MKILFIICIILFLDSKKISAQDAVDVIYTEKSDSIKFIFKNVSNDTIYLFSTYFSKNFLSSKYLHQINKLNKTYTVSFAPLTPYLTAYLTDRIVLGKDKIITEGQNLFEFYVIKPNDLIEITLAINDIFSNINQKDNAIAVFTEDELIKKKFKTLTFRYNQDKYDLIFRFAYYKDIETIISKEKYINAGDKAYFKAREYEVINLKCYLKKFVK
jgi:hypothetical protein